MEEKQANVLPPLVTGSWLRDNHRRLNRRQLDGEYCCYCGREVRTMVPVGTLGMHQLYACQPACDASQGSNRP
jgi:hypothetical protein